MKNLITGGAGFIGSNLIKKLLQLNEEVICLDNFSTGHKSNIDMWLNNSHFELINQNITEPLNLKVDRVWHLACPASPKYYLESPVETLKTCFTGTLNALEVARSSNAKFLLTSSSEVYGEANKFPQDEKYFGSVNTQGIRSCYKEGKRVAESLVHNFNREHKIDIAIARIFNTYGPNMHLKDGRVISNFIYNIISKKEVPIYGKGNKTRSFCYIDDIIKGLIMLMNANYIFPVNFGNPSEEYSILKLADKVRSKIDKNAKFKIFPEKEDEPLNRRPDISLAKQILSWEPKTTIDEGLSKTIYFFMESKRK